MESIYCAFIVLLGLIFIGILSVGITQFKFFRRIEKKISESQKSSKKQIETKTENKENNKQIEIYKDLLKIKNNYSKYAFILSAASIVLSTAFIIYCIHSNPGHRFGESLVSLVAICATLIVGIQIFNTVEHNQTIKSLESKHQKALEEIDNLNKSKKDTIEEIQSSNRKLIKSDGDASRMVSFLLMSTNRPTWAIGWVCRAMKRYRDAYPYAEVLSKSYNELKDQCLFILDDSIKVFVVKVRKSKKHAGDPITEELINSVLGSDNFEEGSKVKVRTFKDILDFSILNRVEGIFYTKDANQETRRTIFISILLKSLNKEEIEKCRSYSWFELDHKNFDEEIRIYNNGKTIDQDFKELSELCPVDEYPKYLQ